MKNQAFSSSYTGDKPADLPKQQKPKAVSAPKKSTSVPLNSPDPSSFEKNNGFPIIGIGASAGGLEAFEQFFSHIPVDTGMAFVIVQHLDPAGHSLMPEILSRFTKMPVKVATDGVMVQPDSIYLMPPNKDMGINGGALFLKAVARPGGLRLPVDFFLRSLAEEKGPSAIAVILSGTGSDGTLGVKAIKAGLGTVFAQEPSSAKYDGMPRSAIDTGTVDFILKPEDMPQKLIHFVKGIPAVLELPVEPVQEKTREFLSQIFTTLRNRTGHDFSRYKKATVLRRIDRRMSVNEVNGLEAYAKLLKEDENEAKSLLKDLLISVTSFLRDRPAFEELKGALKKYLEEQEEGTTLRIWVPGCATGEEAYSIAMIIIEVTEELKKNLPAQVFATDIDLDALTVARTGVYPPNIAADLTPDELKRFFTLDRSKYRVNKELREMILFATQDLIKDPPFSRMDLICCRNVLIYLENEQQAKTLPLFHYALKPGGLLFLGLSESTGAAADLFTPLSKKWKIYRRRETTVASSRLSFPASFIPALKPQDVGISQVVTVPNNRLPSVAEKAFLDNYAPTFALIDDKFNLVYVRGKTGNYLEIVSGQPNLSILDMAREGLRTELASLIYQTKVQKTKATAEGLQVKNNGGFLSVNVTVAPLAEPGVPPGYLLVVFQEMGRIAEKAKTKTSGGSPKRVAALEEELKLTKENLQASIEEMEATNEELKSANEELQSNNEEMQSSNEELGTSQEELQSINEELTTLNAELQNTNESLSKANDDLKNFLNRTDIAIIFLDGELRIRSYTPPAADIFWIKEVDIGRPLADISSRLAYKDLYKDVREVARILSTEEVEVQRDDQHWFTMRILPYKTVHNVASGVVISFLDIDKQKKATLALSAAKDHLEEEVKDRTEELQTTNDRLTVQMDLVKRAEDDLRSLSQRLVEAQENERRQISGKTHDEIGQNLTVIKMMLDTNLKNFAAMNEASLKRASDQVSQVIAQVRAISMQLHPSALDVLGLEPTLQMLFEKLHKDAGLEVELSYGVKNDILNADLKLALYRIIQEALTSVMRYSGVKTARVAVKEGAGHVSLTVKDEGKGFDLEILRSNKSNGIFGMKERVRTLGGTFAIESAADKGTTIKVKIPYKVIPPAANS